MANNRRGNEQLPHLSEASTNPIPDKERSKASKPLPFIGPSASGPDPPNWRPMEMYSAYDLSPQPSVRGNNPGMHGAASSSLGHSNKQSTSSIQAKLPIGNEQPLWNADEHTLLEEQSQDNGGNVKRTKWTAEEDTLVIELRGEGMTFEDISKRLPGRTAQACKLRFRDYLEPHLSEELQAEITEKKQFWKAEELVSLVTLRGNGMKWEDISKQLPGRSARSCDLKFKRYISQVGTQSIGAFMTQGYTEAQAAGMVKAFERLSR